MKKRIVLIILGMFVCSCHRGEDKSLESDRGEHALQMVFERVVYRQYSHQQLRFMLQSPRIVLSEVDKTLQIQGGVWTRLQPELWEGSEP